MSALDDFEPGSIAAERERLRQPRHERSTLHLAWLAIGLVALVLGGAFL